MTIVNCKPIYLIAGNPRNRTKPDPLFHMALMESGKTAPTVAYIGTASDDDAGFFNFMKTEIEVAGADQVNHALIKPDDADLNKARNVLSSADIVFIGGGDVDRGMEILHENCMADFLIQLFKQGKPFFGVSAGSIMLGKEWVRWPDPDDNASAEIFPCLGLAPVICDTHAEEDDWQELKTLLGLEQYHVKGYGIPSGAAIKVLPDGSVEALGGTVHQYSRYGKKIKGIDLLP